jgi:hypothetical protein
MTRFSVLFATPLFLCLTGCGGNISNEREIDVKAYDMRAVIYTAKRDQELTVEVNAADFVNAYLVLENERAAVERQITEESKDRPSGTLDTQLKVKEATLKGKAPGGNEVAVIIAARGQREPVKVKIKATGR